MKSVYLLQVHKEADQVKGLVDLLSGAGAHCFVHVDAKQERLFQVLSGAYASKPAVHIITERIDVHWSGFSQVEATLALLRALWDSKIGFDRVQLMSGEDFPIKRLDEVDRFLMENPDREYMEYGEIGELRWRLKQYNLLTESKANRTFLVRAIQKILRIVQSFGPERENLRHYTLYKGSSWFNLSRDAIIYFRTFLQEHPDYLEDFRYSACADEHFFQTILLNSPLAEKVVNDNLYYMEWRAGKRSPDYLGPDIPERCAATERLLFARKFDRETARTILEKVHAHES
jgi:hypothetical protein